ncbi:AzlD domain-containing protein [Alphaproteobacteria bacterium]|nr:AzlD domain-containing protein [Alphaproteobacteria bacterium]
MKPVTALFGISEMWAAVILAFVATFMWRFLGVMLANRIKTDSFLMIWINALAYAMVAGVLMLILVYPSGILATTPLDYRLGALGLGLLCMVTLKILWLSILIGMGSFALAMYLL